MMLFGVAFENQAESGFRVMHRSAMTEILDEIRIQEGHRDGQPLQGRYVLQLGNAPAGHDDADSRREPEV
jgi:hypothetical protein